MYAYDPGLFIDQASRLELPGKALSVMEALVEVLLTIGTHAHKGYSTGFVCLSVRYHSSAVFPPAS